MTAEPEPNALTRQELQSRAVSGALWTVLHVAVSLPLAFVVNVIVARLLGVDGYGRLALLTLVMELAGVVVLAGVGSGLIQFGAKAHSVGDHATVRSLLSRSQGFRLALAAPVLTTLVLWLADVPMALLTLTIAFGIWVPAGFGGAESALTIQNDTARAARLAMMVNLMMQGAVLSSAVILPRADVVWATRMVVTGLGVIAAIALVDPRYRRAVLHPRFPRGMPSGFWRFSIPVGASGVVAAVALNRSEVVVLEHLSTAEQVGFYAVAFGLAGHLLAPAQALLRPLTPAVSALREVEIGATREAFRRMTRVSGVLGGFTVAIGGPCLALLIPTLYGEDFRPVQDLVVAMAMVSGYLVFTFPMQAFVTARLRGASTLTVNVLSALAAVVLALIAIPFLGAWGAVLAKVAVVVTRVTWLALRETESFMSTRGEFLRSFGATSAAAVTAFLVHLGSRLVGADALAHEGLVVVAVMTVSCAVYLLLLKLFQCQLTVGDTQSLAGVLPKRLRTIARLMLRPVTT